MKKLGISQSTASGTATLNSWKKGTTVELMNNNSTLAVRIDKAMIGCGYFHNHTTAAYVGVIVHLTDTNGNSVIDTFDGGSGDLTADLNTMLEKWKDYVWATDFRPCGTGSVNPLVQVDFDMATKRLLEPGQKLLVDVIWMSGSDSTGKVLSYLVDFNLWYQQAA